MKRLLLTPCKGSYQPCCDAAKKSRTRAELHNLIDTLNEDQLRYTYAFLSKVFERKEK